VHACAPQTVGVAELCHDTGRRLVVLEQADPRHRREAADERRHRHVAEECVPHLGRRQVLRLQCLTQQAVLANERGRLVRSRRRLCA
jgi:hypothetical protein